MNSQSPFWLKLVSLLPDGPWIWWAKASQLESKGDYKEGERDGPWEMFYENGQLEFKGNYKNGR
ncbi:unnamed protein product, partial [marine sediment metagenome]